MTEVSAKRNPSRSQADVWLAILAPISVWLSTLLFTPFDIAAVLFLLYVVVRLSTRRRYLLIVLCVLLTPFTIFAFEGFADYQTGSARLRYMGYPGPEFYNPDPELRCGRSTGGCLVNGTEWLLHEPYNLSVMLMIKLFGPMRGSYTGPYPSREEAVTALDGATALPVDQLLRDRITVGETEVQLGEGVGEALIYDSPVYYFSGKGDPTKAGQELLAELGPITAALYRDRCVILRVPTDFPDGLKDKGEEPSGMIALIDRENGRPYAYYSQGRYYHRFSPVPRAEKDER